VAFPTIVALYNVVKATTSTRPIMTNLIEEEPEKNNDEKEKEEKGKDKHWGYIPFKLRPILFSLEQYFVGLTTSDLLHPIQDLPTPPPKLA